MDVTSDPSGNKIRSQVCLVRVQFDQNDEEEMMSECVLSVATWYEDWQQDTFVITEYHL